MAKVLDYPCPLPSNTSISMLEAGYYSIIDQREEVYTSFGIQAEKLDLIKPHLLKYAQKLSDIITLKCKILPLG